MVAQFLSVAGVRFKHILVSEVAPVGAVILMVLCGGSANGWTSWRTRRRRRLWRTSRRRKRPIGCQTSLALPRSVLLSVVRAYRVVSVASFLLILLAACHPPRCGCFFVFFFLGFLLLLLLFFLFFLFCCCLMKVIFQDLVLAPEWFIVYFYFFYFFSVSFVAFFFLIIYLKCCHCKIKKIEGFCLFVCVGGICFHWSVSQNLDTVFCLYFERPPFTPSSYSLVLLVLLKWLLCPWSVPLLYILRFMF